ncbi:MAG: anion permease [Clostridiales Family XIII bacterium]|jgi:DASS family divalent anion:Na+ symporter|nr:anion permease [Clostridiales Family XIII bacterium]
MADSAKKNSMTIKWIFEAIAVVAGVAIAFAPVPDFEGLTQASMIVLGVAVWGIINWIVRPFDEYITCLIMALGWFVFGKVKAGAIFSGFAGTTFWLLLSVIGIGAAISTSGLLKRISVLLLKFFKPTYKGQATAFALAGTCISPFIPSTTAKMAIMSPLALGIADELKLEKRGAGRVGLLMALWLGVNISGNFFINASFQGYMVLGLLPEETQGVYTWMTWFLRSLPWTIVMLVLFLLFILFAYREKETTTISKDYITSRLAELGPMNRNEKISAVVMAVCLVLFILESRIGFTSMSTAILGFAAVLVLRVIGKDEFQKNMMWPILYYIGFILGMGEVFGSVNLTAWFGNMMEPIASRLTNPYLFVAVLCLLTYVIRIMIHQVPTNVLMITLTYPLAQNLGMDPWIACVVVYGCSVVFYPMYLHPNLMIGYAQAGGEENIDTTKIMKADVAYMIINILGFWACIPFWKMWGML